MTGKPTVSISYSRKDKKLAFKIRDRLAQENISTWIDDQMDIGVNIFETIQKEIIESDFLVVLLTEHSVNSVWVKNEVYAKFSQQINTGQIKVLPVLGQPLNSNWEIPPFLKLGNICDISSNNFEDGIKKLIDSIRNLKRRVNNVPQKQVEVNHKPTNEEIYQLKLGEIITDEKLELRNNILSSMESLVQNPSYESIHSFLVSYLGEIPLENAFTEHIIMIIRRYLISFINNEKNSVNKEKFILSLSEPGLISAVKTKYNKDENLVYYEIASLLAEMGEYQESISLFNKIIKGTNTFSNLILMAMDSKAVLLQNQGLYEDAKKILDEIIDSDDIDFLNNLNAQYLVYKHRATLLRRIHFDSLEENAGEIFENFQQAQSCRDTYHIHFSKGYIHYLLGHKQKEREQDDQLLLEHQQKARDEYDQCFKILGKYKDEYYMIHIKYALILMQLHKGKEWNMIRKHIEAYEDSLKKYGNFKSPINLFLLNLIKALHPGSRYLDPEPFIENLKGVLQTPESLYCMQADLECVLEYFAHYHQKDKITKGAIDRLIESISNVMREFKLKFNKFSSILNRSLVTIEKKKGLALRLKIVNFSEVNQQDAPNLVSKLEDLARKHLSNDFDDLNFYGDGYMFIRNFVQLTQEQISPFIIRLINKLYNIFDELCQTPDNQLLLAVGIGFGTIIIVPQTTLSVSVPCEPENEQANNHSTPPLPSSADTPSYFFGEATTIASNMCELAKPCGIVLYYPENEPHYSKDQLLRIFPFEEIKMNGLNGMSTYSILVSPEVTKILKYKYIFRYSNKENRLFVNYGSSCSNRCVYCITQGVSEQYSRYNAPQDFNFSLFSKEFNEFGCNKNINDFLISLGHSNEALDKTNYENTRQIVDFVLNKTSAVIQVASKSEPNVRKLLAEFSNYKNRLIILFSICTIKYEGKMEPNRKFMASDKKPGETELQEIAQEFANSGQVIPYVKPFLPGITDNDALLVKFLEPFITIVVGYPYLTRTIAYKLSEFCITNHIKDALVHQYYNFSVQFFKSPLKLRHPSLFSNKAYTFDYSDPMMAFIKKINPEGQKKIFHSSPCAVAYLNNTTSYTRVGDAENEFAVDLCKGQNCVNKKCRYQSSTYQLDSLIK